MIYKKILLIIILLFFSAVVLSCSKSDNTATDIVTNNKNIDTNSDNVNNDKNTKTLKIDTYKESNIPIEYSIADKNSGEIVFCTKQPFCGIEVFCSSGNNENQSVSCSLYEFDTDIKTTIVSGKPLLTQKYDNISDNSWLMLKFKDKPAGNYLLVIHNGTKHINILSDTPDPLLENKITYFYNNINIETGAFRFRVLFNEQNKDYNIDVEQYFDYQTLPETVEN